MICTPSYGGVVTVPYMLGIIDLYIAADHEWFNITTRYNSFDSLVTRARNTLLAEFLADSDCTHLMWIDSDIGFTGADVLRLFKANRPIAAGVYPLKSEGWPAGGLAEPLPKGANRADFAARYQGYPATATDLTEDADGFIRGEYAPTGFMLIQRKVLETMIEAYPETRYRAEGRVSTQSDKPHYALFDTEIAEDTGFYLSEDYAFCRKAARLGFEISIDARSKLSHQGVTVFVGDLARSLAEQRSRSQLPPP
jgi:hypothetical protein